MFATFLKYNFASLVAVAYWIIPLSAEKGSFLSFGTIIIYFFRQSTSQSCAASQSQARRSRRIFFGLPDGFGTARILMYPGPGAGGGGSGSGSAGGSGCLSTRLQRCSCALFTRRWVGAPQLGDSGGDPTTSNESEPRRPLKRPCALQVDAGTFFRGGGKVHGSMGPGSGGLGMGPGTAEAVAGTVTVAEERRERAGPVRLGLGSGLISEKPPSGSGVRSSGIGSIEPGGGAPNVFKQAQVSSTQCVMIQHIQPTTPPSKPVENWKQPTTSSQLTVMSIVKTLHAPPTMEFNEKQKIETPMHTARPVL